MIESLHDGKLDASPPISQDLMPSKFIYRGESNSGQSSAQESPPFAGRDLAGCTADIDVNIPIAIDNLNNDEDSEEASEIVAPATSLMAECKTELSLSNLDTAIFLFCQVFGSRPMTHPLQIDAMRYLASALGVRSMYTNQNEGFTEYWSLRLQNPDQVIGSNQDTTAIRQEDKTNTQDTLELGKEFLINFQKSTSLHVLNTVIFLVQQSLPHLSFGSSTRFVGLTTLVDGLYARFNHFHDTTANDVGEAICGLQDAMIFRTKQVRKHSFMNTRIRLCGSLIERLNLTGDISGLRRALVWLKAENTEDTRTATNAHQQYSSAMKLYEQFTKSGNMGDLNTAVTLFREVIAERPERTGDYIAGVHNLASLVAVLLEHDGQQSDLGEAICFHRQAIEPRLSPHPDQSMSLNSLTNALQTRFDQRGKRSDLDEVISLYRQALELQLAPHPEHSMSLSNLANGLWTRCIQGGEQGDLDEAISLHRQALELRPAPHPDRSVSLSDLANALHTQFNQYGERSNLVEAISLHRQALELRPAPHLKRSVSFNNLAYALWTRFNQHGEQHDLDEAISLHRQALELRPSPHPERSTSLNNLANALRTQFNQHGKQDDLDEAISLHRQALELRPSPHPGRSMALNNLALVLWTRFNQH
ncbi:hypothetical protein CVT25_009202, partial [Psilocybe cyanescens]